MGEAALKYEYYTYAQYKDWPDSERWEIIDGVPYAMSAPLTIHQAISLNLSILIGAFLKGKKCKVFAAPFDVRLFKPGAKEDEIDNIVQPDLSVLCDEKKIDARGAIGAPDWIIEITSPSTMENDFGRKMLLYQKYRVKEYWIVNPERRTVLVHKLNEFNTYFPGFEYDEQKIVSPDIFPELKIVLKEVFVL